MGLSREKEFDTERDAPTKGIPGMVQGLLGVLRKSQWARVEVKQKMRSKRQ